MKLLHLTLSKKPFEAMITGIKRDEYRKPSEWILSRLLNKDGSRKQYTHVKFVNGYGKHRPFFIAEYQGWHFIDHGSVLNYEGGLTVETEAGDIRIYLGDITTAK